MDAGRKDSACGWFRKAAALLDQYEQREGRLPDDSDDYTRVRSAAGSCRT